VAFIDQPDRDTQDAPKRAQLFMCCHAKAIRSYQGHRFLAMFQYEAGR